MGRPRKYSLNEDYFKKIDTETKAYWLGFLYADGQISADSRYSLRLALSKKDYNHIVKLKNELSDLLGIKVDLITTGAIKNKRVQKSIKKDLISIL